MATSHHAEAFLASAPTADGRIGCDTTEKVSTTREGSKVIPLLIGFRNTV